MIYLSQLNPTSEEPGKEHWYFLDPLANPTRNLNFKFLERYRDTKIPIQVRVAAGTHQDKMNGIL